MNSICYDSFYNILKRDTNARTHKEEIEDSQKKSTQKFQKMIHVYGNPNNTERLLTRKISTVTENQPSHFLYRSLTRSEHNDF